MANAVTAEIASDGGTDTNYQPVNPATSEKKEITFKEAEISIPQTPTQIIPVFKGTMPRTVVI